MGFESEILADSVAETAPYRLTTFRVKVPAIIQPQMLRHRMFSFSVASTRAIPLQRQIEAVEADPFVPIFWGKSQRGMQAGEELDDDEVLTCRSVWAGGCHWATYSVRCLERVGLHKQTAARLLSPFSWVDMVLTGVWPAFANFFALRCHEAAQPEIRRIAVMMACLYRDRMPRPLEPGQWHLPFVMGTERRVLSGPDQIAVSVARCARVSYNRPGVYQIGDIQPDRRLYNQLLADLHVSPMEHQAQAPREGELVAGREGNLIGWIQYRQTLTPNVHTGFDFATLDRSRA